MREEEQLNMVIQRMRFIVDSDNHGDLSVSYMHAFESLTYLEKAVIVRHAIKIIYTTKQDTIISDTGINKEVQKERQDIIKGVVNEDKALKYFIAKIAVVFAFTLIGISMFIGLDFFRVSSGTLVEILKLIFGTSR